MSTDAALSYPSRPDEVRATAALAAIGAWTIIVPYLAVLLGLEVDVAAIIEVVDHVIPGLVVVATGLYLRACARRRALASHRPALLASGVAFLAGFWVLATHAPLIGDAALSDQPWDAAIWHSIAALPIVVLACWCVIRSTPDP